MVVRCNFASRAYAVDGSPYQSPHGDEMQLEVEKTGDKEDMYQSPHGDEMQHVGLVCTENQALMYQSPHGDEMQQVLGWAAVGSASYQSPHGDEMQRNTVKRMKIRTVVSVPAWG